MFCSNMGILSYGEGMSKPSYLIEVLLLSTWVYIRICTGCCTHRFGHPPASASLHPKGLFLTAHMEWNNITLTPVRFGPSLQEETHLFQVVPSLEFSQPKSFTFESPFTFLKLLLHFIILITLYIKILLFITLQFLFPDWTQTDKRYLIKETRI